MTRMRPALLFALLSCISACTVSARVVVPEAPKPGTYVARGNETVLVPSLDAGAPTPRHRLGSSVPIPAPSTAGIALVSNGPTVNPGWTALNLGQAGAVTGTLPTANMGNLAGDVTGAPGANTVVGLTGSAGTVTATASTLSFSATSHVKTTSGDLYVDGAASGLLRLGTASTEVYIAPTSFAQFLSPNVYFDSTAFSVRDSSSRYVATFNNNGIGASSFSIGSGVTGYTFTQAAPTTDAAAATMTVQAQAAEPGATTHPNGGNLVLQSGAGATTNGTPGNVVANIPAPTGTGTEGHFQVQRGGASILTDSLNGLSFGSSVTQPTLTQDQAGGTGSTNGVALQIVAQQGQNETGAVANTNGGNLYLSSGQAGTGGSGAVGNPGSMRFALGRTDAVDLIPGSASPDVFEPNADLNVDLGSASNRFDALYVANASITLNGLGGNAAAGSAVSAPLVYQTLQLALSSGTVTLSASQASHPLIQLTGNTTAAETIVFPNTATTWYLDTSTAGTSQTANLTIECGTAATTRTITQSSGSYPNAVYIVYCNGSNKLFDNIWAQ